MAAVPKFVTFTGLDRVDDVDAAARLSRHFPVEWGVLLARSRAGSPRYPHLDAARSILQHARLRGVMTAVHLCGSAAREFAEGIVGADIADVIVLAQRVQVNIAAPDDLAATARTVAATARKAGLRGILQVRGDIPENGPVDWLFDQSGGKGVEPKAFPRIPKVTGGLAGIAGGLGPDNVARVLDALDVDGPFWIDMESRVRTEDDRLCFDRCEEVAVQAFRR